MEDIRKIVRKCIQESFWTEKEWDMHLGKEKSKNNPSYSKLKNDIKEYVESENFQLQNSVFFIMNLAKKANPGDSEYDLIDTLKGFILDLEGEDEHMDDKFRNRFKKVYEDLHSNFGLTIFSGNTERFAMIGDEYGMFLCINTDIKDYWLPTDDKINYSPFEASIQAKHTKHAVTYSKEKGLQIL